MNVAILRRFLTRSVLFLLMVTEVAINISPETIVHQFSTLPMQILVQRVLMANLISKRNNKHLSKHFVFGVSIGISFVRFWQFPPIREAFHSWFITGRCICAVFTHDEPVISVKDVLILCNAQYQRSRRIIWCIDQRIWDPGITDLRRIDELLQVEIVSNINNIRRLWSFIQEMIAKNDNLINMGLILEKERNGLIYPLASKTLIFKASWKFTSLSFFLIFGYKYVHVLDFDPRYTAEIVLFLKIIY